MDKRQHPLPELTTWPTRDAMVARGLAMNLPWLAFVNISIAVMLLLRNILLHNFDTLYHATQSHTMMIDAAMFGVVILSLALMVMGWRHIPGISALLFTLSLIWSFTCFWVITDWQLQHAWPLCVLLLLSGLTALYFHPVGMLSFILPLWVTLPLASIAHNHGMNIRFFAVWGVFSLILLCGRFILLGWFNEAWRRNQQNQLLIARLDALAHQDPLTETANRRAMEKMLEQAVSQGKAFSVLMLDVDYFKLYNDTYGHQAGDACLYRVARVLKQSVRSPDDVVSRYGGEEFCVILFECDEKMAEHVAARIQTNLRAEAIAHSASKVSDVVTASQGIASMAPGLSASDVIARADAALYRAKEAGRNRWSG